MGGPHLPHHSHCAPRWIGHHPHRGHPHAATPTAATPSGHSLPIHLGAWWRWGAPTTTTLPGGLAASGQGWLAATTAAATATVADGPQG